MKPNSASEGISRFLDRTEAMLLDFDGVIADSEPFFRISWNRALEPWGHSISEGDYWKYWTSMGEGLEGEIRRKGLTSVDPETAYRRQKSAYREIVESGSIPLFPGARRLLDSLAEGDRWGGRPFCIASNTPAETVRRILRNGGCTVPEVIGGEGLRKKPAPDIFLEAASRLGCSPGATMVLEDSWKGVSAADKGGFFTVLVLNRYNRDLGISSDFRIDGLEPLIGLLT